MADQTVAKAVAPHVRAGQQIIVREGALILRSLRRHLSRRYLTENFGDRRVKVGSIPYYETFNAPGKEMPLREFIDLVLLQTVSEVPSQAPQ